VQKKEQSKNQEGADSAPTENRRETWNFNFKKVLHNAGQESTYAEAAERIVSGVVEGLNGTVMAYGQTGAGKTFTMTGDTQNFGQRGIIPRAIAQLFHEIDEHPQQEFSVFASFMEIYNEKIFDLLDESGPVSGKDFQVTEDPKTQSMHVRGVTMVQVEDEEEALGVVFRGEENRVIAEHQLNKQSNRSHSIFTLHVEQKSKLRSEDVMRSKLNLVDLAGSERLKKAIGDKMDEQLRKESRYINKSLSYLEQVVVALTSKTRTHVPYRQSKLTNILKDSLGGNSNTSLIACIWGESRHLEESISTLKLAQRMMRVENSASSNLQMDASLMLKRYERQICELKQELMMHDALANRSGVSYEEFTSEDRRRFTDMISAFVEASPKFENEKMLPVESVRQVQECFRLFKLFVQEAEGRVEERLRGRFLFSLKGRPDTSTRPSASSKNEDDEGQSGLVGDIEGDQGFALGVAPANAKPKQIDLPANESKIEASPTTPGFSSAEGKQEDLEESRSSSTSDVGVLHSSATADISGSTLLEVPSDRDKAFEVYLRHVAIAEGKELQDIKERLVVVLSGMQGIRRSLQSMQGGIDEMNSKVQAIRSEQKAAEGKLHGNDEERIIDEEEYVLLRSVKDMKKQFKEQRSEFESLRTEKENLTSKRDEKHACLLRSFQSWFLEEKRKQEEHRAGCDEEILDDCEQFDQLELARVKASDPDSLAFFKATKAQRGRAKRNTNTKRS